MHEVLVNRLGGLSLSRKSVVRLTDRPDTTLDVYRGRKTQYNNNNNPRAFDPGSLKFLIILNIGRILQQELCHIMQSTLDISKLKFIPNNWYLKVNFLVPENLL